MLRITAYPLKGRKLLVGDIMIKLTLINESINNKLFNLNKTGTSYYDSFLDPKEHDYMKLAKGLKGEIKYMTKDEYFKECSTKIFHKSVSKLYIGLEDKNIEKYVDMMRSGTKFNLGYLNYENECQEGRHRMIAADRVSPGDKFPVLVVTKYDANKELGLVGSMRLWYGHTLEYENKSGKKVSVHVGMNEEDMKKKVREIIKSKDYR